MQEARRCSSQQSPELPQGDIFCRDVREFAAESRKCQTLYANCEGSYERRKVDRKDKSVLDSLIFGTISNGVARSGDGNTDDLKEMTELLVQKISNSSGKFDLGDEIHFFVVWIYYFDFKNAAVKSTPVFKIFKHKSGSEAIFLDTRLIEYESWDCLIENIELSHSFACFPRGGEYNFRGDENVLDLEFVVKRFKGRRMTSGALRVAQPCSKVVILKLWNLGKPILNGLWEAAKLCVYFYFPSEVTVGNLIILCFISILLDSLKYTANDWKERLTNFVTSAKNNFLMFQNKSGNVVDIDRCRSLMTASLERDVEFQVEQVDLPLTEHNNPLQRITKIFENLCENKTKLLKWFLRAVQLCLDGVLLWISIVAVQHREYEPLIKFKILVSKAEDYLQGLDQGGNNSYEIPESPSQYVTDLETKSAKDIQSKRKKKKKAQINTGSDLQVDNYFPVDREISPTYLQIFECRIYFALEGSVSQYVDKLFKSKAEIRNETIYYKGHKNVGSVFPLRFLTLVVVYPDGVELLPR